MAASEGATAGGERGHYCTGTEGRGVSYYLTSPPEAGHEQSAAGEVACVRNARVGMRGR
jgi:hypothetical protein